MNDLQYKSIRDRLIDLALSNFTERTSEVEDYVVLNCAIIVQAIRDIHSRDNALAVDAMEYITSDFFKERCDTMHLSPKLLTYIALHPEEYLNNISVAQNESTFEQ